MTKKLIDTSLILASLKKAVESKGAEYVYPKPGGACVYVSNGAPSCLVGHVVADLFPDKLEEVAQWDRDNEGDTDFHSLQDAFQFPITPEAHLLLTTVQADQDMGVPWGAAVETAEGLL